MALQSQLKDSSAVGELPIDIGRILLGRVLHSLGLRKLLDKGCLLLKQVVDICAALGENVICSDFNGADGKGARTCGKSTGGDRELENRSDGRYYKVLHIRSIARIEFSLSCSLDKRFPPAPISHCHQPLRVIDALSMT